MKAILCETLIALILAVAVYAAFDAGLGTYLERRELERQVAMLEREIEHLRVMVEDAHFLAENMERTVAVVETDYTAREFLWLMRDHFAEAGIEIVIH